MHLDTTRAGEAADHWNQDWRIPPLREPAHIGICVSGGGVRAGSVALGALQALRTQLLRARYLVSVSGGGYLAGALQLALQNVQGEEPATQASPEDVFAEGSLEEDHVRRHSSYLSDGPKEWLTALGVLLRGVVSSLAIIALTVASLGVATGWFYRVTRIADLRRLRRFLVEGGRTVPTGPRFAYPTRGVAIVIVGLALLATLLYVARVLVVSFTGRVVLRQAANRTIQLALLFGVVGAGIPALGVAERLAHVACGVAPTPGTVATTGAVMGGLDVRGDAPGSALAQAEVAHGHVRRDQGLLLEEAHGAGGAEQHGADAAALDLHAPDRCGADRGQRMGGRERHRPRALVARPDRRARHRDRALRPDGDEPASLLPTPAGVGVRGAAWRAPRRARRDPVRLRP